MKPLLLKLEKELKVRNFSKETIKGYIYSVEKFLNYSVSEGINPNTVKNYIIKRLEKGNPSSVAKDSFAIKFFFEKVLRQKLNLPAIKRNKILPEILTIGEIRRLLINTPSIKHKLIIKLIYGTGLRVSEIVNLEKKNLDFEESLIHIKLAKGKKDRFVKIPNSIKKDLKMFFGLSGGKYLFESNRGGETCKVS